MERHNQHLKDELFRQRQMQEDTVHQQKEASRQQQIR
jgi:hypothetical protein